jgi:hypothetical protein
MSRSRNRFVPSLETLGERLNPGVLAGAPGEPADAPVVLEGHQALVFFLGGSPAAGEGVAILHSSLPGGAAEAREQPRPTILLQRLANPSLPDAAAREVRHRTFAIVDRTQLGDGEPAQGGSSGTHVFYQDIVIPAAAGSADKDIVLKGSKIGENAPIDVDSITAPGEADAALRRNQVTTLSADLDRPGTPP